MIYEWTRGNTAVSAQVVGETIAGIAKESGRCTPKQLVDEATPDDSPLHPLFTWDDTEAAERWRVHQARNVINNITVRVEHNHKTVSAPAFVSVGRVASTVERGAGYRAIQDVSDDPGFRAEAMQSALSEINGIRRRYAAIKELAPIWDAADLIAAG